MKKHIEVVAAIVVCENDILCMQRSESKYDYIAFKWEFPGGKIEQGETHEQALLRELEEEMNYKVEVHDLLIKVTHEYPDFIVTINAYNCTAKDKEFMLLEHNDFLWLKPSELLSLDWAAADIPIAKNIIKKYNAQLRNL